MSRKNYYGQKGSLHGLGFESGFEKKFIRICRQLGIRLERSKHEIRYQEGNPAKWHTYYPDFYWPDVDFVVEIKGTWAFKTNHGFIREKYAAAMVKLNGRYTVLTEKELTSEFILRMYKALLPQES